MYYICTIQRLMVSALAVGHIVVCLLLHPKQTPFKQSLTIKTYLDNGCSSHF